MNDIVKRLLEAKEFSGLSYADLARLTGLSKSTIQRYLSGYTDKVPLDFVQTLCRALNIREDVAMGWADNDPAEDQPSASDMDRLEALHQNPRLGLLFDRSRRMSERDVEFMLQMAERILQERDGD